MRYFIILLFLLISFPTLANLEICEINGPQASHKTFRYHFLWIGKPLVLARPEVLNYLTNFCKASTYEKTLPGAKKEMYLWYDVDLQTQIPSVSIEDTKALREICQNNDIDFHLKNVEVLLKPGAASPLEEKNLRGAIEFFNEVAIPTGLPDLLRLIALMDRGGCYFDASTNFDPEIIWKLEVPSQETPYDVAVGTLRIFSDHQLSIRTFNFEQEDRVKKHFYMQKNKSIIDIEKISVKDGTTYYNHGYFYNNNFIYAKLRSKAITNILNHINNRLSFIFDNPVVQVLFQSIKRTSRTEKYFHEYYPEAISELEESIFLITAPYFNLTSPFAFSTPLYNWPHKIELDKIKIISPGWMLVTSMKLKK
jgi:hypothetical protein